MVLFFTVTPGRTPLDEWSTRRRDLYLTTHNTQKGQTSLTPVGFEPAIPASERPQTHALDRAATVSQILPSVVLGDEQTAFIFIVCGSRLDLRGCWLVIGAWNVLSEIVLLYCHNVINLELHWNSIYRFCWYEYLVLARHEAVLQYCINLGAICRRQRLSALSYLSVRPSAWHNSAVTGRIFMKLYVSVFFEKLSRKFRFFFLN